MSGEDACKAGNDDEIARAGRAKTARRRPVWSMRGRQCAGRAAQSSCVWMYAHAFCTRSSQAGMGVSDGVEVACVRVRCSLMMSLMAGPCVCSGRCTFYRTDWRLRTNALLGEGVQSACGVMRGEPQLRVRARRAQRREARTLDVDPENRDQLDACKFVCASRLTATNSAPCSNVLRDQTAVPCAVL